MKRLIIFALSFACMEAMERNKEHTYMLNDVHVRQAQLEEFKWINERYREVDFLPSNPQNMIAAIAEVDNKRVGLGRLIKINTHIWELSGIYTFEAYQKQGIARQVVNFLLSKSEINDQIFCLPYKHLEPFYRSFGFEPCEEIDAPEKVAAKLRWCNSHYEYDVILLKR